MIKFRIRHTDRNQEMDVVLFRPEPKFLVGSICNFIWAVAIDDGQLVPMMGGQTLEQLARQMRGFGWEEIETK